MVSVENGKRFALIKTNKQDGPFGVILTKPFLQGGNLCQKGLYCKVEDTISADAFDHGREGKIAACQFPPERPREYSDLIQIRRFDFHLIPLRTLGQLSPQGQMPDK